MKKYNLIVVMILSVSFLFSSVSSADENKLRTCSKCGKEIKAENKKFSVVQKDASKPVAFDDIGCAVVWRDNQCTAIQMAFDATAKVYDFYSEEEIDLSSAFFVKDANTQSPGGHGIAAFKDKKSADTFMSHNGGQKVLTYDDLLLFKSAINA